MKHRTISVKGLAFQSWMYISLFSVFILVMLWILQVVFLNTFYEKMKTGEILTMGERLTKAYGDEGFNDMVEEYAISNGAVAAIFNEEGVNLGRFAFLAERAPGHFLGFEFEKLTQRFDDNNTHAIHFTVGEPGRQFIVYMSRLKASDGKLEYLAIISMLPPIDATAKVLQIQLKIISGIVMILSFIVALLFAQKLSVPIIEITRSAKRLAQGDLSVKFKGGGYEEVRELADTLNYATNEISKADKYQKEFIANISHDLRTPLTLIKFYGEMIRDVSGDDKAKRTEACDTIISEADWLTGMVNELLELSKLQLSDTALDMQKFDISDCLKGIIETVGVMIERGGYKLELDIEDGITVAGNEQGLKRAMYNLIGNALNYTGDDKRIDIALNAVNGGVRFEVSDTGSGVPEDETEKVWERYYKSGQVHKRAVIGTGIGLSIVKNVLAAHNAAYGVSNLPEGGAKFWFELSAHDNAALEKV